MRSFVYFVADANHIRIGITKGDPTLRLATHSKYGLKLLAILPGNERNEKDLHGFFSKSLAPERDSSTYWKKEVLPYVERLLEYKYATNHIEKAMTWSSVDFRFWHPDRLTKPLIDRNGQGALFVTGAMLADERDCYETPENVLAPCRFALSKIDLDPCSNSTANERVRAEYFYDIERDGLSIPWFGTVFLNPPYGGHKEPGAALFTRKLIDEISSGRVCAAITVLNLQSWPTRWFPSVWEKAQAHAVWASRIDFIRPRTATGAKPYSSSKNGTIFSYFGRDIERFKAAFDPHASVFQRMGI